MITCLAMCSRNETTTKGLQREIEEHDCPTSRFGKCLGPADLKEGTWASKEKRKMKSHGH